jgi:hypothetical protein
MNAEQTRLDELAHHKKPWRRFGAYLSERQWGTVREDYSPDGAAWDDFSHDQARARAYRWGEDGIGGLCDWQQRICLAVALWNGRDPILKERLFGLTNSEGNHGEDVKELYYYLDATPTHSYLKMLYKYPQAEFPYASLVHENRNRGKHAPEFELIDTGVFDDDRYFDVVIEYAKAGTDDVLMRVTATNRGPEPAMLHILPQIWFRNTWSWGRDDRRPRLSRQGEQRIEVDHHHPALPAYAFQIDGPGRLLFTENETNPRLWGSSGDGHYKDAFHDVVISGQDGATNPAGVGTKAAAHYAFEVPAGGSVSVRARLEADGGEGDAFADFDQVFARRIAEADAFYAELQQGEASADRRHIQRQALAGMIWGQQFYYYDIPQWLDGDPGQPAPPESRKQGRNREWRHLNNADIISMPDTWEYPWYAAWDLAFHCVPLAMVDPAFAKKQLVLLCREWYMHPNGQLPAYEWAFGDVNPPVHAWATWRVFQMERERTGGDGDLVFLERVFHKLLLNFTWWVNRKDPEGNNVFGGGFLGLDNIGVFDRSSALPTGGTIEQADGTAWMGMFSLNMMRIALELAQHDHVYEDIATKFFEHFLHIAEALMDIGGDGVGLWHEEDRFYYDVLRLPDGEHVPMRLRSMVGLIPLFAVEILDEDLLARVPGFTRRMEWFLRYRPDLAALVSHWNVPGEGRVRLLSLARAFRMKRIIERVVDPAEFLSDYGVRALSKIYEHEPYVLERGGQRFEVRYLPAESDSGLFGGNSNWRGPIWWPVNYLLIESLRRFHRYYGDAFVIACPTGSPHLLNLRQIADELARRLIAIFEAEADGRRPALGAHPKLRSEHFKDHVLFYEYFHGDNGRGVGAGHQTGWTGLVAKLIQDLKEPRA